MSLNGSNRDTLKYLKGAEYSKPNRIRQHKRYVSLEKALKKIYEVKSYDNKNYKISVPRCLKDKKVKLILLGGNNK